MNIFKSNLNNCYQIIIITGRYEFKTVGETEIKNKVQDHRALGRKSTVSHSTLCTCEVDRQACPML